MNTFDSGSYRKKEDSNMKILYLYDDFPSTYQGYMSMLLAELKGRFLVKTMTYKKSSESDHCMQRHGIKDILQSVLYTFKLSKYKSLDVKLMSQFDIIHLQHSHLWKKVLPIIQQAHGPKVVITLRGSDTYIKPWGYFTLAERFYARHSLKVNAFITMSAHQKQYLTRWGVPEAIIHVIPISFGPHSSAKPKYPNSGTMKLVSAFRMTWEKNIDGTVRFAKALQNAGIPFVYDIYGDGPNLEQLYYLVDRYGLQDCVCIKGKVDNADLKEKLPKYDFFVQLSLSEALSASVIEAQAAGLPCVVSDSNGLPEAIIENKTAIMDHYTHIENLANSCIALWQDQERYYSFSSHAIRFVNTHFTVEKEVERLETLYKNL
ncbi:MAG TPA: glycosyltransferase family 4 protein [Flavobacteriaceae bacterium]